MPVDLKKVRKTERAGPTTSTFATVTSRAHRINIEKLKGKKRVLLERTNLISGAQCGVHHAFHASGING